MGTYCEAPTERCIKLNLADLIASLLLLVIVSISCAVACGAQNVPGRNGSLLTPQAASTLMQSIDLNQPDMLQMRARAGSGGQTDALKRLAAYYRSRTSIGWDPNLFNSTPTPQSRADADDAVQGKLRGGTVALKHSFASANVDWHLDATANTPGNAQNNEWQWQLNRMAFWSDLARAYHNTGDERYAQTFVGELRSWIVQCSRPGQMQNGPGSAWRTIDTGIRTSGAWMDAFYAFRNSPSVTDDDILAMVNSFREQGEYLRQFNTKLNWLTMEMSGLYAIGAEFPEFKAASEWRSFAANTLDQEAQRQFLPDGAQEELSSSYQQTAINAILRIVDIARWTNRQSELPSGYMDPMERAFQYEINISAPDRQIPKINDSWAVSVSPFMRYAVNYFPNQPVFQWFATEGSKGNPPAFTSTFLNRSGMVVMRSDWSKTANYLLFRAGPLGLAHQQQESLDIQLWGYGREMISNGGGGNYENSKWREYGTSAYAHSTVVVDGLAQTVVLNHTDPEHDPNQKSQGPINVGWKTNPIYDFATKDYDQGYGPSSLRIARDHREILYVKPDLFIVADRLFPSDTRSHRYEARWQLKTTNTHLDPPTGIVASTDTGSANLAVVPLSNRNLQVRAVSAQENPELLGWQIRTEATPEVVPATTVLHAKVGAGPQLILTMLVPYPANHQYPIERIVPGANGVSATVTLKDGRQVTVDCSGTSGIRVTQLTADGSKGASIDVGRQ